MAAASPPAWLEATPCPGLRRVLGGCGTWEPLVPSGRRVRFLTTLERRLGVVSWISSWRQLVRTNKFGIRGLKSVRVKGRLVYFWGPPVSLQKRGIFQNKTLGTDFDIAAAKAREWNVKLDAHRGIAGPAPPALGQIMPKTVADLFQKFEASPRFEKYVYPVHVMTRKFLGEMTRKLSVTESQKCAQLRGTCSRRKPSVASANCAQVA
jgi:hypothetical protein